MDLSQIEAATRGVLQKKVFLEISRNSQENTCARLPEPKKETLAQVFSCYFAKFLRTPFYRTLLNDCFYRKNGVLSVTTFFLKISFQYKNLV